MNKRVVSFLETLSAIIAAILAFIHATGNVTWTPAVIVAFVAFVFHALNHDDPILPG